MKLAHPDLNGQILLSPVQATEWVIESPRIFASVLQELNQQVQGEEGRFVLSADDKIIRLDKTAEIFWNPFSININDRKILNRLHAQLGESSVSEDMYLHTQTLVAALQAYMVKLEEQCPYMLRWNQEMEAEKLFKFMGVCLEDCSENFMENIEQFLRIAPDLLHTCLLILVNFSSYMTIEQKAALQKAAMYQEVSLLFLENKQRPFLNGERWYIIDEDGCEIYP